MPAVRLLCVTLLALALLAPAALADVEGPIPATAHPGDPSHDYPFFASDDGLAADGYVEREYFVTGTATRYNANGSTTATPISSGHPFKTRIVVRRPASAAALQRHGDRRVVQRQQPVRPGGRLAADARAPRPRGLRLGRRLGPAGRHPLAAPACAPGTPAATARSTSRPAARSTTTRSPTTSSPRPAARSSTGRSTASGSAACSPPATRSRPAACAATTTRSTRSRRPTTAS